MTTPTELEAAVERVTEAETMPSGNPEKLVVMLWKSDVDAILHALAEANERASLLQTALAASEARRGELEARACNPVCSRG